MTPERRANCARFCIIQKDLWFLEKVDELVEGDESSEFDKKEVADKNRKLVNDLLDITQDENVRKLLDFTQMELVRLRNRRELTEGMRIKFRIFVDDFLDVHMPLELASSEPSPLPQLSQKPR